MLAERDPPPGVLLQLRYLPEEGRELWLAACDAVVCPYRHVSLYVDLTDEETSEFTALTKQAVRALQGASEPHGFNLGMNQGAVAGAGVAAHLPQHVVPRWSGDSNFLPIIAQTKALPVLLEETRSRLVAVWPTD